MVRNWGEHFQKAYGAWPKADEAAYASWFDGPLDLARPDWPRE